MGTRFASAGPSPEARRGSAGGRVTDTKAWGRSACRSWSSRSATPNSTPAASVMRCASSAGARIVNPRAAWSISLTAGLRLRLDRGVGRPQGVLGGGRLEVAGRVDAVHTPSGQFASAMGRLADIERAVQRACEAAAGATGDAQATAEIVRFCDRLIGAMDDTCGHLLEVAGGLRRALDAMWEAAGGGRLRPGRHAPGPSREDRRDARRHAGRRHAFDRGAGAARWQPRGAAACRPAARPVRTGADHARRPAAGDGG